jgi:hypothetical protein
VLFVLNLMVQLWGVIAGLIVWARHGFTRGLSLVIVVSVLHWLFTKLSMGLTYIHQKTILSQEQAETMACMGQLGMPVPLPTAWKLISGTCGLLFFGVANLIILGALSR